MEKNILDFCKWLMLIFGVIGAFIMIFVCPLSLGENMFIVYGILTLILSLLYSAFFGILPRILDVLNEIKENTKKE
jgi:hypothetical protein